MENNVLKKKLMTYLSAKGRFTNVSNELLFEVLLAWEQWPGKAKDFYKSIGFGHRQMAGLIGKAKKLKRGGVFPESDFTEVSVESPAAPVEVSGKCNIEILWGDNKIIRFGHVDLLLDFLKKAA